MGGSIEKLDPGAETIAKRQNYTARKRKSSDEPESCGQNGLKRTKLDGSATTAAEKLSSGGQQHVSYLKLSDAAPETMSPRQDLTRVQPGSDSTMITPECVTNLNAATANEVPAHPHPPGFTAHQPKLPIGRRVSSPVPCASMPSSRKRGSSHCRPNIRAVPDFEGDPIEE